MLEPCILLFHGKGLISSLIRLQTRGKYSHAALLHPSGDVYEAIQWVGVRTRNLYDFDGLDGVDRYVVPGMTNEQWGKVFQFCTLQLGKGYDYWAIIRFIDRQDMPENERYFCSELVFDAMQYAGVHLFERIKGWSVSPGLLSISPRVTPQELTDKPEDQ